MINKKYIILGGILILALAFFVFANLERKTLTSNIIKDIDDSEIVIKPNSCFTLSDGSRICQIQKNVNVKGGKTKVIDEKIKT